jgi:hypothetical protein
LCGVIRITRRMKLQEEIDLLHFCGRNSRPRQDNDLMNYEQKRTSLDQGHEYKKKILDLY